MDASFASKQTISDHQHPEESGWTSYFDDFFSNQKQDQYSSYSNTNNILVSDAASFVGDHKKFCKPSQLIPSTSNMPKFSMKKPSTKEELLYDDSLDDTASSPVNRLHTYFQAEKADTIPRLPGDEGSEKRAAELLFKERKMMVQT